MSFKSIGERQLEAQKKQEAARRQVLEEFSADPYLGYESLDAALADYKCTTQAEVMARLLNRESVFISGPAGSGKTTLINKFIRLLDAEYSGNFEVAITASTGIAATLINGSTIHSWAGLGIDTEPFNPDEPPKAMLGKRKQMLATDVLIIDEISMLPAYLFEKLDAALRHFRRSDEPFGGVQMVLMGDFLQLPPVDKNEPGVNANFAVMTSSWQELAPSYCYMDKVHRAKDPELLKVLSKISRDKVDAEVRGIINSRIGIAKEPGKLYTTLYTTNRNVDKYNEEQLAANPNSPRVFFARTSGKQQEVDKMMKANNIPQSLTLKLGATVIATANGTYDGVYVANGSIGEVTAYSQGDPLVRFNNGSTVRISRKIYLKEEKRYTTNALTGAQVAYMAEVARLEQLPLKLGYAITVHKSQGQTFDGVVVDLSKCFTPGLGYVALSRVRELSDLIVEDISETAYKVSPKSKKVSNYVKHKALHGRKDFIARRKEYEALLKSSLLRSTLWKVEESGAHRVKSKTRG